MKRHTSLTTMFLLVATTVIYCGIVGVATNVDTVVDSCKAIRQFMDFDFCVSRLRSVPGSASADMNNHFFMALDLATVSASLAWDTAMTMAHKESNLTTRDALEACGNLHWAAAMPALRMYRQYVVVKNFWVVDSFSFLMDQAGNGCDAALKGYEIADAEMRNMIGANHEFIQLSAMADLILKSPARM